MPPVEVPLDAVSPFIRRPRVPVPAFRELDHHMEDGPPGGSTTNERGDRAMNRMTPQQAMSTLKKWMLVDGFDVLIDYEKSSGCTIVDQQTGRGFLDMFSMVASNPIGMNHAALTDKAFLEKIGRIAIQNP